MEHWMSIDFGTSSSAAVIVRGLTPELVTPLTMDAAGSKIFPTVTYVDREGRISTCHQAEQLCIHDLSRFVREFKLDMNNGEAPIVQVSYTDIVAEILKTLKRSAEKQLQEEIKNVVITVPAIYSETDVRQGVMLQAARLAGFDRVEFIKEAQAAAIYYDYIEQLDNEQESISLIYDLGGGTFDPVLIQHSSRGPALLGNGMTGIPVGGKFFTEKIVQDYVAKNEIRIHFKPGDAECIRQLQSIKSKCEFIKRFLSEEEKGSFPVEGSDKNYDLTRTDFEGMISGMLDRTLDTCDLLIHNNDLSWDRVNRVLLIGGSCNIPLVRQRIRKHLNARNGPNTIIVWRMTEQKKEINPQFAVALGGGVYARKKYIAIRPSLGLIGYTECGKLCNFVFTKEGTFVLGRNTPDNQLDIAILFASDEKKLMSRQHLKFVISYDVATNRYEYCVEDLGSANGTYVNGQLLTKLQKLNCGDIIRAGHHEFTLSF